MDITNISDKDRKMLELLVQGIGSKAMAQKLGYKDGTMRVYLHGLYKRLGVPNKTSAVSWYFEQTGHPAHPVHVKAAAEPAMMPAVMPAILRNETFGDFALRTSLQHALGVMSIFFGAYGRPWEVSMRLKGEHDDAKSVVRRQRSRALWEAYLAEDFQYVKKLFDTGETPAFFVDSPSDCVVLACALLAGGYTYAADMVIHQLPRKKNGSIGLTANEFTLVNAMRDALYTSRKASIICLHHLVAENASQPSFKHAVMVALYFYYRKVRDIPRATATANAIWAEAESVRQHLQAMGERTFDQEASMPAPLPSEPQALTRYLEKIAVMS